MDGGKAQKKTNPLIIMTSSLYVLTTASMDSSPCLILTVTSSGVGGGGGGIGSSCTNTNTKNNGMQRILVDCGEGTQRACLEGNQRLSTLRVICLTSLDITSTGGLPGLLLTAADTFAIAHNHQQQQQQKEQQQQQKKKKNKMMNNNKPQQWEEIKTNQEEGGLSSNNNNNNNTINMPPSKKRARPTTTSLSLSTPSWPFYVFPKQQQEGQDDANVQSSMTSSSTTTTTTTVSNNTTQNMTLATSPSLQIVGPYGTQRYLQALRHFIRRQHFPVIVHERGGGGGGGGSSSSVTEQQGDSSNTTNTTTTTNADANCNSTIIDDDDAAATTIPNRIIPICTTMSQTCTIAVAGTATATSNGQPDPQKPTAQPKQQDTQEEDPHAQSSDDPSTKKNNKKKKKQKKAKQNQSKPTTKTKNMSTSLSYSIYPLPFQEEEEDDDDDKSSGSTLQEQQPTDRMTNIHDDDDDEIMARGRENLATNSEVEDTRTKASSQQSKTNTNDNDNSSIGNHQQKRHPRRVVISYLFITPPLPGKFRADKAVELGVPRGPLYGQLKAGHSVTFVVAPERTKKKGKDGSCGGDGGGGNDQASTTMRTVHSWQVVEPSRPGVGVLIVRYPNKIKEMPRFWKQLNQYLQQQQQQVDGLGATASSSSSLPPTYSPTNGLKNNNNEKQTTTTTNTTTTTTMCMELVVHVASKETFSHPDSVQWRRQQQQQNQTTTTTSSTTTSTSTLSSSMAQHHYYNDDNVNQNNKNNKNKIQHVWINVNPRADVYGTPHRSAAQTAQLRSLLCPHIYQTPFFSSSYSSKPSLPSSLPPIVNGSISSNNKETVHHEQTWNDNDDDDDEYEKDEYVIAHPSMEYQLIPRTKRGFVSMIQYNDDTNNNNNNNNNSLHNEQQQQRQQQRQYEELHALARDSGALSMANQVMQSFVETNRTTTPTTDTTVLDNNNDDDDDSTTIKRAALSLTTTTTTTNQKHLSGGVNLPDNDDHQEDLPERQQRQEQTRYVNEREGCIIFTGTASAIPCKHRNVSGICLVNHHNNNNKDYGDSELEDEGKNNRKNTGNNNNKNNNARGESSRNGGTDSHHRRRCCLPKSSMMLLDVGEGTVGQLLRTLGRDGRMDDDDDDDERDNKNSTDNVKQQQGKEFHVLSQIKAVWISHPHADHHLGLLRLLHERRNRSIRKQQQQHKQDKQERQEQQQEGSQGVIDDDDDSHGRHNDALLVIAPKPIFDFLHEYAEIHPFIKQTYIGLDCRDFLTTHGEDGIHRGPTNHKKYNTTNNNNNNKNNHSRACQLLMQATGIVHCQSILVQHCPYSYGVILDGTSFGRVVYSGDCRPSRILANAGKGANVLIHEATFEDGMEAEAKLKRHCTIGEALQIANEMQAQNVILTHFSQRYPKIPPVPSSSSFLDRRASFFSSNTRSTMQPSSHRGGGAGAADVQEQPQYQNQTQSIVFAFDFMTLRPNDLDLAAKLTPALRLLYPGEEDDDDNDNNDDKEKMEGITINAEAAATEMAIAALSRPGLFAQSELL